MSDFVGTVEGKDTATNTKTRIRLDADEADVRIGGDGRGGDIEVRDDKGNIRILLDAGGAETPTVGPVVPPERISLSGADGSIKAGGNGQDGELFLTDTNGKVRIAAGGKDMRITLRDQDGSERIRLDPAKDADCVVAQSDGDYRSGVYGTNGSPLGYGVFGRNTYSSVYGFLGGHADLPQESVAVPAGVVGQSDHEDGAGVVGIGGQHGVRGVSDATWGAGVNGYSRDGTGVSGESVNGTGVWGWSGKSSESPEGSFVDSYAGYFHGDVVILFDLFVGGSKQFRIDHPLEPTTKYLDHSSVESDEMLNVYSGNAILDANGEAWIDLPEWFEVLNGDFRYHLTAIGRSAPNMHIAEEISENRFQIGGGPAGTKVSWQVTGTRRDAYARSHPMQVEVEKHGAERGTYLHPIEHGVPDDRGIQYEKVRRIRERIGAKG